MLKKYLHILPVRPRAWRALQSLQDTRSLFRQDSCHSPLKDLCSNRWIIIVIIVVVIAFEAKSQNRDVLPRMNL